MKQRCQLIRGKVGEAISLAARTEKTKLDYAFFEDILRLTNYTPAKKWRDGGRRILHSSLVKVVELLIMTGYSALEINIESHDSALSRMKRDGQRICACLVLTISVLSLIVVLMIGLEMFWSGSHEHVPAKSEEPTENEPMVDDFLERGSRDYPSGVDDFLANTAQELCCKHRLCTRAHFRAEMCCQQKKCNFRCTENDPKELDRAYIEEAKDVYIRYCGEV
uniref:CXC domain-containing protein n=1 Tax=Steinernema glaseri TaxID=37863 RepID=A0A1I7YII9_9BILA